MYSHWIIIHWYDMCSPNNSLKYYQVQYNIYIYTYVEYFNITLTSWRAQWRLNASLFAQLFVLAQIKKKHQRSTSLAFVRGIQWWPVDSPGKGPVTRKISIWWHHHDVWFRHHDDVIKWKLSASLWFMHIRMSSLFCNFVAYHSRVTILSSAVRLTLQDTIVVCPQGANLSFLFTSLFGI